MTIKTVFTGSITWEHPGWEESYYPDGLPDDWRLDYYSHHFQFVVLEQSQWAQADEDQLAQWLDDVHEEFGFFLALQGECGTGLLQAASKAIKVLGDQLSGFVALADSQCQAAELSELAKLRPVYVDRDEVAPGMQAVWRLGRASTDAGLAIISADKDTHVRTLREQVEVFLAQSRQQNNLFIVFEGDGFTAKLMQDTQVVADMLT